MYRNQLIPPYPLANDLCAYCLRHTFCTNLQKKGVDLRTAQYFMGHESIEMTANIYTHVDFEIIGAAAKQMSGEDTQSDAKNSANVPKSVPLERKVQ